MGFHSIGRNSELMFFYETAVEQVWLAVEKVALGKCCASPRYFPKPHLDTQPSMNDFSLVSA